MSLGPTLSIALIALAPFMAALLAPSVVRFAGPLAGWVLAAVPGSIFAVLVGFIGQVSAGRTIAAGFDWIPDQGIRVSFFIDGLSLMMALAISGIGTLIVIYSGAYLAGHRHLGRFFAFMLAFTGAMLGLVLADNTIALFTFWELTSVTSFLLIGFDHERQAARRAAIQALIVTNIGGLALLVGAIVLRSATGSWDLSAIRAAGLPLATLPVYPILLVAFLLAAFTKSAQVPFHFWLPNAMEAPTPVSAFLHSATMVQAGVYLLARMHPLLGDTQAWTGALTIAGGLTLVWGTLAALRQTDLKMMLAHTTVASLGLLVLLLGQSSEIALAAAALYFVAHALYKSAFFLIVGAIDKRTGTRDITVLGGLSRAMPLTFCAAALAGFAMVGLPPAIGFLAKEEMYRALTSGGWETGVAALAAIAGNVGFTGLALALVAGPFLGTLAATPKQPREAGIGMVLTTLVLALGSILAGLGLVSVGQAALGSVVAAMSGRPGDPHLSFAVDVRSVPFWLSIVTWGLGIVLFLQLTSVRKVLRRAQAGLGFTFDTLFDRTMFGLIGASGAVTRTLHHGRLELYLVLVFCVFALALGVPMISPGGLPDPISLPRLTFYEWAVFILAALGLLAVLLAPSRLTAIVSLGIQGAFVGVIFLLFGAPDLAFTQFTVEILSVVVITLVMTRLRLDQRDPRGMEDLIRDGSLALVCGIAVTLLLLRVLQFPLDPRLPQFFAENSLELGHGRNIVNVILVDFRGLDTLGEIAVVMAAALAVLTLIRPKAPKPVPTAPAAESGPTRRTRRRPVRLKAGALPT